MTERADDHDQLSGRQRKLVECCADPVVAGDVGGIGRLATENPGWGYQRCQGEVLKITPDPVPSG